MDKELELAREIVQGKFSQHKGRAREHAVLSVPVAQALIKARTPVEITDTFEDVYCPKCSMIVAGIPNFCASCGVEFEWL
jgi:hypothetical protein